MIAKQIDPSGVELTYDVNGRLDSVTTEIQARYLNLKPIGLGRT